MNLLVTISMTFLGKTTFKNILKLFCIVRYYLRSKLIQICIVQYRIRYETLNTRIFS